MHALTWDYNWASVSDPLLIVFTCMPHTVGSQTGHTDTVQDLTVLVHDSIAHGAMAEEMLRLIMGNDRP